MADMSPQPWQLAPVLALTVWLPAAFGQAVPQRNSSAGKDPWHEAFVRDGFNVVRNVLTATQLRRAKRALKDRWLQDPNQGGKFGKERQYALLELDPVFAEFLEAIPPSIVKLMDGMMGPWIIGAYDIYKFNPVHWAVPQTVRTREKAMSLHSDYPYGHHPHVTKLKAVPAAYPPTVQLIFMVDDFTRENGGTVMLPGSYKQRRIPQGLDERLRILNQTRTVTGRAGDLVVYIGQTWHGNDLNVANEPRVGVIAQCLPWFFKPMQSFMYTLPWSVEKRLSTRLRTWLGLKHSHFNMHTATMGYDSVRRKLYHVFAFLWDMLCNGYRLPWKMAFFRQCSLLALQVPVGLFLVVRFEALRLLVALLVGMFLGVAMTLERFGM
mmetsp:Transcript_76266/g.177018  ORF Transcript_76266/g.177018 Transcript_76266/m.177018 type:complete len:380 (+) Transcript_76266:132-1271(+)